jgi:hypothetical protein
MRWLCRLRNRHWQGRACSYDPNYGKVIKLQIDLPIDPLYAPCLCLYARPPLHVCMVSLSESAVLCSRFVYDRVFGIRKLIGSTTIELARFIPWFKELETFTPAFDESFIGRAVTHKDRGAGVIVDINHDWYTPEGECHPVYVKFLKDNEIHHYSEEAIKKKFVFQSQVCLLGLDQQLLQEVHVFFTP